MSTISLPFSLLQFLTVFRHSLKNELPKFGMFAVSLAVIFHLLIYIYLKSLLYLYFLYTFMTWRQFSALSLLTLVSLC